jgi:chromosome segregation protein
LNAAEVELARAREAQRMAERAAQEARFMERALRDKLADAERRGGVLADQIRQTEAHHAQLAGEHTEVDWTPIERALQEALTRQKQCEQALAAARDRMEGAAASLRRSEEKRLAVEQKIEPARNRIEEARVRENVARTQEEQFAEQLREAGADLVGLPEQLQAWGKPSSLPAEIESLQQAIVALGAVNLAALEELQAATERKDYLDRQAADLNEAIDTLESAIRRIDRETRALLQETYDTVNRHFGELFPMLFGGGQARLLLTGEEILDAGIQVIAQPPGKRNSSIHLLSGGEKALTALALVFAMFQLNPAPFCLLDEVDAPLDDPNTDRFCGMVKRMALANPAGGTQFLFISHNKITMEMANQLVGVTMAEPGVSRVVAVDIGEALQMAEAVA